MKAPEPVRGEVIASALMPHPDDSNLAIFVIETDRDFLTTWYGYKEKEYFWGTYFPKTEKEGKEYFDQKAKALMHFASMIRSNCDSFLTAEVI